MFFRTKGCSGGKVRYVSVPDSDPTLSVSRTKRFRRRYRTSGWVFWCPIDAHTSSSAHFLERDKARRVGVAMKSIRITESLGSIKLSPVHLISLRQTSPRPRHIIYS